MVLGEPMFTRVVEDVTLRLLLKEREDAQKAIDMLDRKILALEEALRRA